MTQESRFFMCLSGFFGMAAATCHVIYRHICKSLSFLVCPIDGTDMPTNEEVNCCCEDTANETVPPKETSTCCGEEEPNDGEQLKKRANKGYCYKIIRNISIVISVIAFISGALLLIREFLDD